MDTSSQKIAGHSRKVFCRALLRQIALLLLIFAVPALSTLAKTSWYLPQADTGHYLTGAIKMKAAKAAVRVEPLSARQEPSGSGAFISSRLGRPQIRFVRRVQLLNSLTTPAGVTIAVQPRSPPLFRA